MAVEYYLGRHDDAAIQQSVQVLDHDWQNVVGAAGGLQYYEIGA